MMMTTTTTTLPALAPLRQAMAAIQAEQSVPATLWGWALELVLTRRIWPSVHVAGHWLEGDGTAGFDYLIVRLGDRDVCGCKAFRRRGGVCMHTLALELYRRLQDAP
jgi:hypothetical protein